MADESNFLLLFDTDDGVPSCFRPFRPGGIPEGARYNGRTAISWRKSIKGEGRLKIGPGRRNGPGSRIPNGGTQPPSWGGYPREGPSFAGQPGTETSKYPEEEKSTEIARVCESASPNRIRRQGWGPSGVADGDVWAPGLGASYKTRFERNGMGKAGRSGESPVREEPDSRFSIQAGPRA